MPTPAGYLTVEEAANTLHLSPITVRSAIRRGRLPAQKFAGLNLIAPTAVEDYRREHLGRGSWPKRRAATPEDPEQARDLS